MTSIHDDAATTGPVLATTAVDAAEALCFARDLGGTLTHVLVAAAGRALAAEPTLGKRLRSAEVGLAVTSAQRGGVAVVPGARDASLPQLRAEIDVLQRGSQGGRSVAADDHVAIVVVETEELRAPAPERLRRASCVLEVGWCEGDPLTLVLTLHADRETVDVARAELLLARIARLVERPYRRLV